MNLSQTHTRIGDLLLATNRPEEAEEEHRLALSIQEPLALHEPDNMEFQRNVAVNLNRIGDCLLAQKLCDDALQEYNGAVGIEERLASKDPMNALWQRDVALSYWKVASALEVKGSGEARVWFEKAYTKLITMKEDGLGIQPFGDRMLADLRRILKRRD